MDNEEGSGKIGMSVLGSAVASQVKNAVEQFQAKQKQSEDMFVA